MNTNESNTYMLKLNEDEYWLQTMQMPTSQPIQIPTPDSPRIPYRDGAILSIIETEQGKPIRNNLGMTGRLTVVEILKAGPPDGWYQTVVARPIASSLKGVMFSPGAVEHAIGIDKNLVRKHIHEGLLAANKRGRRYGIPVDEILSYASFCWMTGRCRMWPPDRWARRLMHALEISRGKRNPQKRARP